MTGNELRAKYLKFFADRGHTVVPSASLVPENDPTTLFTGSGMQPMLPYLLGETSPYGKRIVDSQRCFRVQDIEEVGNNRHTTAFEMLGNWSLGDYFKQEQLPWFWEFLTKEVRIDPQKLYVTVFAGNELVPRDDEAIAIWTKLFESVGIEPKVVEDAPANGMQGGKIFTYPARKNWWSRSGTPDNMPAGEPGGPDSEVFYEFTDIEHDPAFGPYCHVNCDCGRFLEIGNSVFMQYRKQDDGSFVELPQRNIDFGGGLERILAASQNTPDVFKTDLFEPIISEIEKISGSKYDENDYLKKTCRVIADHTKAATFLISDRVVPSNKTQGYVLRRLIRRTVHAGHLLGIDRPFIGEMVKQVQAIYGNTYPSISGDSVVNTAEEEEAKFQRTLDKGIRELHKLFVNNYPTLEVARNFDQVAADAFNFFQTLGLPVDIFLDELAESFIGIYSVDDRQEIQGKIAKLFIHHQAKSREGSVGMFKGGLGSTGEKEVEYHTVTHLLQQALRDVLGDTVQQRGSNITAERLRFDFTAEARMTPEQISAVETIVNEKIQAHLPVSYAILPIEQAKETGAIGLFGEKYGDAVKVYSIVGTDKTQDTDSRHSEQAEGCVSESERSGKEILDQVQDDEKVELAQEVDSIAPRSEVYSREFCGGPHVANTGMIHGRFRIQKDEKIARDVVRIKAVLM